MATSSVMFGSSSTTRTRGCALLTATILISFPWNFLWERSERWRRLGARSAGRGPRWGPVPPGPGAVPCRAAQRQGEDGARRDGTPGVAEQGVGHGAGGDDRVAPVVQRD